MAEYNYDPNSVNPTADLSYNASLRGYGASKETAQAQADYQRKSLDSQLAQALPAYDTERKEGVLDATETSGQRGAIRSSSNLLLQDKAVNAVNTKEAAFKQGIADQQAQIAFGLQNTLNSLEQSRAEAELTARTNLLQAQNQSVAYQKAAEQYGLDANTSNLLQNGYNG